MKDSNRIASNQQARRVYHISETVEAGLCLQGTEVKSLRGGKCQLRDGFCRFEKGELYLYNVHIAEYERGNWTNHEPKRPRKLLLHKSELKRFYGLLTQKGLTIVPLKMYFRRGMAKVEIGLAKPKKLHDRRQDIKKRIADREIGRAIRHKV